MEQFTGNRSQKIFLPNPEATHALGIELAKKWLVLAQKNNNLKDLSCQNPFLLLKGNLGAGKTCLVKGIAEGLGIKETVTSPTFALSQHYTGNSKGDSTALVHMDLYRLEDEFSANELFTEEQENASFSNALIAVEWPERLSFTPNNSWLINLSFIKDEQGLISREAEIKFK